MKKKTVGILAAGMVMASLAGCGTKAEVISQEVATEEEPIVVTDEEDSDNVDIETEVIGGNEEDSTEFAGAEDENIVLYAERGEQKYVGLSESAYYENVNTFSSDSDMLLYDGEGFNIGYVKANSSVVVTESAEDIKWSRFENPISGTDYDYLYIGNDYLIEAQKYVVTTEDLRRDVIAHLNNRGYELATILDEPAADMEMCEFRMYSTYMDEAGYKFDISYNCDDNGVSGYMRYAVEAFEDEGDVVCRIYFSYPYAEWMEDNGIQSY